LFAAIVALFVSATIPPIVGLAYSLYVGWTPPSDEGQYLTPEESFILIYAASLFIGAVAGLPSFFILRRTRLTSTWRLALAALILGTVTAAFLWFGATAREYSVLWVYPIAAASALVFGGIWRLLGRPAQPGRA
jgi:hypothetical protein